MEYRRLGQTGLKVSTICLGTMQFGWTADEETSCEILDEAVELGCNFIDTADIYSSWIEGNKGGESEAIIGRWLSKKSVNRQNLVIATKVRGKMGDGPNDQGLSRQHILNGIEESLQRLQTDYIDLYQVHWPDRETPLEETLGVLDDLVRSGKVLYIGCSNYPAWLLAKSLWISDINRLKRFETVQPHYNLVHRSEFERELQPLCADQGIGVIPYSPLAAGFLTGKYQPSGPLPDSARVSGIQKRYMNESGFRVLEQLKQVAESHSVDLAQVAIAWILANPEVDAAIIGANSTEQLIATMAGADIKLSDDDKKALNESSDWD
ncbi:MAG: aldo/keto reductase [Anaerolineae bacterium]|nr:MAG: aldo/keto reductase [Anaerolineae bacterium]